MTAAPDMFARGREIVEEEQRGKRRAGYGAKLLSELSSRLTLEYGRGYSVDNLEAFRQFYLTYPALISEPPSRKSAEPDWQPGVLSNSLSWSHYRQLLRVSRLEARSFYEVGSALFQRGAPKARAGKKDKKGEA